MLDPLESFSGFFIFTKQKKIITNNKKSTKWTGEEGFFKMTAKEIISVLNELEIITNVKNETQHPMQGKYCVIRTYSAGVHIGRVDWINPQNSMEVKLTEALRLWKWEGGGLSLSAVANNGIKGGRLNYTGEVFLTNVIEMIPVNSEEAKASFKKFIED